jgi:hypothetical protein
MAGRREESAPGGALSLPGPLPGPGWDYARAHSSIAIANRLS